MEHVVKGFRGDINIEGAPDKCPYCHNGIKPTPIFAYNNNTKGELVVLMNCPLSFCQESFLAYYETPAKSLSHYGNIAVNRPLYLGKTTVGKIIGKEFPDSITEISVDFVKIYNEAFIAEQSGLLEICGVGYRKSLEFLIKDYAIRKFPDKQVEIEKKMLAPCIKEYVSDVNVKKVAIRAVWLGNDETHYVRRWEGKNLNDLKKLIDLTLIWIEAEVLTESIFEDMPD